MARHWFKDIFPNYAHSKGFELLHDDYKFIEESIKDMPENEQRLLVRRYLNEWLLGSKDCDEAPQKQNKGRFRANTFLREFVRNGGDL